MAELDAEYPLTHCQMNELTGCAQIIGAVLLCKICDDTLVSLESWTTTPDYPWNVGLFNPANLSISRSRNNRGNALWQLKRFEEALASFDKALAIKPDFAEAPNNRGNALLELKRAGEALASYDKAFKGSA